MEAEAPATADAADRADRKFRREESDGGAPRSFMADILVLDRLTGSALDNSRLNIYYSRSETTNGQHPATEADVAGG